MSWKTFCQKQDKERVWEGIYRVIDKAAKRQEDLPLRKDGVYLKPKDSAVLLAAIVFPMDAAETDTDHHRQIRKLAQEINAPGHDDLSDLQLTKDELRTAMVSFNLKKATGADGFTADICCRAIPRFRTCTCVLPCIANA